LAVGHHENFLRKKKFKAAPSAGNIMATVFWDSEVLLLVVIVRRETTINSEAYVNTLKRFHSRMRRVQPHRRMEDVLQLHDNARPQVSLRTTEAIKALRRTVLSHQPYSRDLAPSDYLLFGKLEDIIRGTPFEDDDSLVASVKSISEALVLSFTTRAYMPLFRGGVRQLRETETTLNNSILFLKAVPIHYMNIKVVK
jgi:histone-lysine N-methyltransferase SETMAR